MDKGYYKKSPLKQVNQYGPDPILLRKRGIARIAREKYELYKRRIEDPNYMEYAINKIASEITHFLSK